MRRAEQEIRDRAVIEEVLRAGRVCRIGLSVDDRPYVVPVYHAYRDGAVYFHSAAEGKKVAMIRRNPRVAIEVTAEESVVPAKAACAFGAVYRSVLGSGIARFVSDPVEKRRALQLIMEVHSGTDDWEFPAATVDRTLVIRVDMEEMTGKQSPRGGPGGTA